MQNNNNNQNNHNNNNQNNHNNNHQNNHNNNHQNNHNNNHQNNHNNHNNNNHNNNHKRKPSNWQLFLRGCIPDQPKELGMGQKVTACGAKYRELKEKDPKRLEHIIESIKSKR